MAGKAAKVRIGAPPPGAAPKSSSMVATIGGMFMLTGLGLGAGGLFGLQIAGKAAPAQPAAAKVEAVAVAPSPAGPTRYPPNVNVKTLPAVVTNLAAPERAWIRLEVALLMENEQSPEANVLATAISEDILAFLRTVSLQQIEGASGFQHLREDLNDRVRIRSGGKVRDVIIQTMVVE